MKRKQKRSKKKQSWIQHEYSLSWKFIKESKNFIWSILGIFLLATLIGYFFPIFYEEQIMDFLKSLINETDGFTIWQMIVYLFQNNLLSAFFGLFLGIFFGIMPIANSIINGYLIGFVAGKTVAIEGISVLWRLVPHGIFELPALFLSLGLGLRLGLTLFTPKRLSRVFADSLRVFVFVIFPLLLIAAIIEGILIVFVG